MDTINVKAPQIGMSGEYRAVLRNEDESVIYDSGWQDNLVTTRGEYLYASRDGAGLDWASRMYIGSSGAAPAYSDTAMGSILASSGTVIVSDGTYNGGSPNYEHYMTKTFRFNAGVGTGQVRELGMGTNAATNYLFSHHLLTAVINKLANNILDVSYRFTIWPSLIETTQSPILIDGVNYECKTSWYNLAETSLTTVFDEYQTTSPIRVYDGVKAGPTDSDPSGDVATSGSATSHTFATGSQTVTGVFGLTNGNTILEIIKTAGIRTTNSFWIQTEFSALDGPDFGGGIPKDGTKELTLNWTLTYGERP